MLNNLGLLKVCLASKIGNKYEKRVAKLMEKAMEKITRIIKKVLDISNKISRKNVDPTLTNSTQGYTHRFISKISYKI